ncbi:MAG: HNH endonuclease [Planctomycetota bacterium]|nr:HNH endonuclease [Planctomycetota bacterium]
MVLERPTLVLNKHWTPIDVTSVLRALCKLVDGHARAVRLEDYSTHDFASWTRVACAPDSPRVRTATCDLLAPEVIVLTFYDRVPERKPAFSRYNVLRRDGYTCQYCGAHLPAHKLTVDHVLPRAQGGCSVWANCVAACVPCNRRKRDRTPETAGMALRSRPARPEQLPPRIVHHEPRWAPFVLGQRMQGVG